MNDRYQTMASDLETAQQRLVRFASHVAYNETCAWLTKFNLKQRGEFTERQEGKARQAADAEREVVSLRLRLEYGRDLKQLHMAFTGSPTRPSSDDPRAPSTGRRKNRCARHRRKPRSSRPSWTWRTPAPNPKTTRLRCAIEARGASCLWV